MARKVVLPSNVEAERSLLGAMLMDNDAASVAVASLTEKAFSGVDPRNVLVFRAMNELSSRSLPIDTNTVANQLINMKLLDDAGGTPYLLELVESSINPDNVNHYAKIVKDQSVLRDYLLKMDEIKDNYSKGEVVDIGDFIAAASQELNDIASTRSVGDFQDAKTVTDIVRKQIDSESKRSNRGLTGVDTGYRRLNKYTHGWQKGNLVIIAARPSVGKTAFALNLAYNATSYRGKPVAFFSCEMSADLIMKRLVSSVSLVNSEDIQTGDVDQNGMQKISAALDLLRDTKLYIDDTSNPLLGDLLAKARKLKAAEPELSLIVIDYLNIIRVEGNYESKSLEVAHITSSLKELARSLEIPVIALCQLNRDVDKNEGHIPMLSNLKDSGSIEQDADIVLLMYRGDYYKDIGQKDASKEHGFANNSYTKDLNAQVETQKSVGKDKNSVSVVTISVAKNRNGRVGLISLLFSKSFSRFDSPSLEMERQEAKNNGIQLDSDDE